MNHKSIDYNIGHIVWYNVNYHFDSIDFTPELDFSIIAGCAK